MKASRPWWLLRTVPMHAVFIVSCIVHAHGQNVLPAEWLAFGATTTFSVVEDRQVIGTVCVRLWLRFRLLCTSLMCGVQECLVLVQAVLKSQGAELMTARLQQFKETNEEGQRGVGVMLQCFQNMTEIDPEMPDALAKHSDLVSWLVSRVHVQKFPKFDENKGLAATLLSTLAQVCPFPSVRISAMLACLSHGNGVSEPSLFHHNLEATPLIYIPGCTSIM